MHPSTHLPDLLGLARRAAVVLTTFALLTAGLTAAAVPAQAETGEFYKSSRYGTCIWPWAIRTPVEAYTSRCATSSTTDNWYVDYIRMSPSNHRIVKLRNVDSKGCLDSNAAGSGGVVWVRGCNNGDYQRWEVFNNADGSITFKSWGAWTLQGRHLCMRATAAEAKLVLAVCNVNNADQRWI